MPPGFLKHDSLCPAIPSILPLPLQNKRANKNPTTLPRPVHFIGTDHGGLQMGMQLLVSGIVDGSLQSLESSGPGQIG